jgi:hypothetical protein
MRAAARSAIEFHLYSNHKAQHSKCAAKGVLLLMADGCATPHTTPVSSGIRLSTTAK